MSPTTITLRRGIAYGMWLLAIASLLGLVDAIFNYFWTGDGIHGTAGAALVIVSSALLTIASGLIAVGLVPWRWVVVLIDVLLFLGILGTGFAAYMLDAWVLVGLMVAALIGWFVNIFPPAGNAHARVAR